MSTQSRKDGITQFVQDLNNKIDQTQQQIESVNNQLEKILHSLDVERLSLDQAKEK